MEWELPGNCVLQSVDHDQLFLVTVQNNGVCLSTVSVLADVEGTAINASGIPYEYRLDLFTDNPTLTYNSGTDKTKVYFKAGSYDPDLKPVVVVDDTTTQRGTVYANLTTASDGTGWYVEIPGDRTTAYNVVLGYAYEFRMDLPVFYRRQTYSDGRAQADVSNIPRVTRMTIQSNNTGPYSASVELLGRTTKTYVFEQMVANVYDANTAPVPELIDNTIPIYGKGTDARVSVFSETPFPLSFVAATWYGVYSNRGIQAV